MPSVAPPPTSVAAITLSVYRAPSCTKVFGVSDHNLPNLPVILGPNITGNMSLVTGSSSCSGSFYYISSTNSRISASVVANANNDIGFSASKSTSIYGNSTTVQPSSLVLNYVIKY